MLREVDVEIGHGLVSLQARTWMWQVNMQT